MPHETWREAVDAIREATQSVTEAQQRLAAIAGIHLPTDLPSLVAAARLKTALRAELNLPAFGAPSDFHDSLIEELGIEGVSAHLPLADSQEAEAWVHFLRLKKRRACLEHLQIAAGDIVELSVGGRHLAEVSSIGDDGCVYFKGGGGARAWPDLIEVRCRKGDTDPAAQEFRTKAANQAAMRNRNMTWSHAKHAELEAFLTEAAPTREEVAQLRQVIDEAEDERPIQAFIEEHPHLLTALLGGQFRYCLPRLRLEDNYVPDFFIADVNSLGVNWVLVELETPRSAALLQDGSQLEQHARKGKSQVDDWREWIQNHLDQARRPRRDRDGLGLFDIRPQSDGLVLVGRRSSLPDSERAVRARIRETENIHVHTYDWLLEKLEGILTFIGPPASNPHLLELQRDKSA